MTDRIPVTSEMVLPLADFVCPGGACSALAEATHAEEYFGQELAFERGEPKDGIIYLQANGKNILALREDETITNLEYQSQYNFCPAVKPCKNLVKTILVALFGEEELKDGSLSQDEKKRALKLRADMGLSSADNPQRSAEEQQDHPARKSFLSDRWKGWRLGGEVSFNFYQGPGGGSKLWLGYRQDRWDFRIAFQGEGVQLQKSDKDFRLGLSFDPVFHLLQHPFVFDPYLNLPGVGLYHLFQRNDSGLAFSPLGGGLQVHLNDAWSLYAGAKFLGAFPFQGKPQAGVEVPLGFSGHF